MKRAVVNQNIWNVFACIMVLFHPAVCTADVPQSPDASSPGIVTALDNNANIVTGAVLVRIPVSGDITTVAAGYGLNVLSSAPSDGIYRLAVPPGGSESGLAKLLNLDPRVIYAETEPKVVAPWLTGEQFHVAYDKTPDSSGYTNQEAYQQVGLSGSGGPSLAQGVIVAVLDTGATFDHPDLIGRYLAGYNELDPTSLPWDLPDGTTNFACGHGTMVAGIIAKVDANALILPVRVLNADGQGDLISVINGINYAVAQGAQVINMSFGTSKSSRVLQYALNQAASSGVLLVASAGNEGTQTPHYPAGYNNVLAVASVDENDVKSDFSNYGNYVDAVAPGNGIQSTYYTGGYASWSGTSFAAPFVSGEASAILESYPGLDTAFLAEYIRLTATSVDDYNPNYAGLLGAGLINISLATGGQ